jgi:hypothetical protein
MEIEGDGHPSKPQHRHGQHRHPEYHCQSIVGVKLRCVPQTPLEPFCRCGGSSPSHPDVAPPLFPGLWFPTLGCLQMPARWKIFIGGLHDEPTDSDVQLTGQLYQPAGGGPFPAVVFLHGCAGIDPVQGHWAYRLQQWGYVVLLVDSFGPRGVTNLCASPVALSPMDLQYVRMPDAYAAQAYLGR